jgi:hypothetical protein
MLGVVASQFKGSNYQFVGSSVVYASNSAARVVTPHASTAVGDVLVVLAADVGATGTLTAPAGWSQIKAHTNAGTLGMGCWLRVRAGGDTTYAFPISAATNSMHTCISLRGVTSTGMMVGSNGTRLGSGGTFTTTAPTITTSIKSLILCLSAERTTATETGISSVNNGFVQDVWYGHGGGGIESTWIGSKIQGAAGAVGATSVVYPNTQNSNGLAFHIALPLV